MRFWLEMPIDAKKNQRTKFSNVIRCDSCNIGMLTPQPTPQEIPELYILPEYYTHGQSHIRPVKSTLFDKALTKIAWIFDNATPFDPERTFASLSPKTSVLDLGCGSGRLLEKCQQFGAEVVGVEPDPSAREIAVKKGIRVIEGTAEQVPDQLSGQQFDLVLMTHTLEHCLNPRIALNNAFSFAKAGGIFYVEVPNCSCIHFEQLGICSEMFDSPRHLWFFSPAGLRKAVESAGFVFSSFCFEGFTRHHSPSWRAWENTIAEQLAPYGLNATRHTYFKSIKILGKSLISAYSRRYDCVGILARK